MGAAVNIAVSWAVVTLWLGIEQYLIASMLGLFANIVFNFQSYSRMLFQDSTYSHAQFISFCAYSAFTVVVYLSIVRFVTPLVGLEWYLVVSIGAIACLALVNFFFLKRVIFG